MNFEAFPNSFYADKLLYGQTLTDIHCHCHCEWTLIDCLCANSVDNVSLAMNLRRWTMYTIKPTMTDMLSLDKLWWTLSPFNSGGNILDLTGYLLYVTNDVFLRWTFSLFLFCFWIWSIIGLYLIWTTVNLWLVIFCLLQIVLWYLYYGGIVLWYYGKSAKLETYGVNKNRLFTFVYTCCK